MDTSIEERRIEIQNFINVSKWKIQQWEQELKELEKEQEAFDNLKFSEERI